MPHPGQGFRPRDQLRRRQMALVGRVRRLNRTLERELKTFFGRHGLELWEMDVLLTLRRAGEPYALTPGSLLQAVMVTSGVMTNRIDRLEAKDFVERQAGADDRRSIIVRLTPRARTLLDELLDDHPRNEARLFSALTVEEHTQLSGLLRKVLADLGDTSIS
jgi:DNA-binding MarR family transcriptional regulator